MGVRLERDPYEGQGRVARNGAALHPLLFRLMLTPEANSALVERGTGVSTQPTAASPRDSSSTHKRVL